MTIAGSGNGAVETYRPLVTFVDPLTWSRDFSYEIEQTALTAAGVELVIPADEAERDRILPLADVVISSGTMKVGADMIARLERCVGIQCYSVGKDAVDSAAADLAGIPVANVNASTADVADHTMALLLAMERRLFPMVEATERNEWVLRNLPDAWEIRRLEGQTLGIVGAGRIGRTVAQRARAFGFRTIAHDRFLPDPADPDLEMVELGDLFAQSDAVVVCASLDADSHELINDEVLAHIKPGAYFVNCARGGLVDEAALARALNDGRIRMAALDVRNPEPPDPDDDHLGDHPNVIQTPHMAAMSDRTRIDVHHLVAENVIRLLRAGGRLGVA
jgi:D-3-phosphoglycerate dehydrogenase / 2-oxoglutarate reductase